MFDNVSKTTVLTAIGLHTSVITSSKLKTIAENTSKFKDSVKLPKKQ